ncbi:hypothetical protein ZWY2020_037694 [Hordeum vulgare]|nr:hypothetical protein ZWY2020_037694 [Hordeum vulgare]
MERAAAGSEQGTPDSEMGDGDGDSVGYGTEMELDPSSSAYPARPSVHDGVDPYEGMEFDDEEDAWTFYNLYARRVGFSTRISVMHRSRRDGSIMSRQFVCAKEGFRTYRGKHDAALSPGAGDDAGRGAAGRRTRAVTRVGCKAMIRVKKQDAGKWAITKLETAHNHPLVPQNQAHCLRPHKPLSECGKQRSSSYGVRRNGDRSSDKKPDEVIRVKELKEEQRSTVEDGEQSQTWRYNSLCREALRYAEEGASSTEVYIVAMQALQEAANKVNMAKRAIGQVAPLAVMPITAQAPESAGKFYDGFGQQKKRKRNSNNSRENSAPNQFMHMQQPSSYLFVGPSASGGSQGPSQLVAAIPVSSCAQHGQTSGANNSTDGNMTTTSVAVDKFHGFSGRDAPTTAPSSGNVVQAGETKSSGVPSQINEIHELSQANGNKGGSVNMVNSTASPQLVTVPIGFCLSSMDNSKMSAVGMSSTNSGGMTSNGNASFGIRQCQSSAQAPVTHSEAKPPAENTDSRATTADSSSIRAAAIAAGARIASPSDAASIIKAAQSKDAIHIRPGESLPNQLKPLAPRPLSSLAPSSAQHLQQPGQNSSFGDSTAAKEAIFGSTDGSDGFGRAASSNMCGSYDDDQRKMASHIVGYPRMGPKRELKFALESFWDGKSSAEDLEKVATDLRASIWKQMSEAGIKYIPSNTFSYYDQVLDTTAMLGAVPDRYSWTGGEIGHSTYFSMARGNATVPAMEMTKWFDTNYHFIVPELSPATKFSYASHKAVSEYKEAKALGVDTVPVLVGPVSYLLLSKAAKGVVAVLKAAGASWIQFDEPTLVKDLAAHELAAFSSAYAELESALSGLNVLIETYFADVPAESYKTLTSLSGVTAYDGRNIWADDLAASLSTLQSLESVVGKDKLVVSTSCSLMHTAVDLVNETKLDSEIKSWLAFAAQKVVEVNALGKALAGQKDEAYFAANAAAQASRRSSPRVNNEEVQKAAAALKGSDHRRATPVSARLDAQQKKLNLPVLPTTTIGSFPQTMDLRRVRREYKAKKISEEDYVSAIKEEISKVVKIQEELDIDVLVHGEPERNDMVEYFGEQLSGFAFTANGWVQSYGSRCVKPPIIYGDVSRPNPMTVFWSKMAQSMTPRPMKGMLTGPVTILNWSFVRNDQPRFETCYQIALAIKKEVEDLEAGGIQVIQIDEAALREGLPLRKSEHAFYLDWAVHSFRITNCGVQDTTQIHTHMCYSNFNDIIHSIINMDADVITIENSRSDEKLLSVFREGVTYGAGIGPGVYDIHSPRIPSTEEIADRVNKMLAVLDTNILWVNPDCGLKTRKYTEVKPALTNMVAAAKLIRTQLASTK